jgi:hypothetical protein
LDRGLGVDNRRWRWRLAASLDEGAMAADQRLVRPAFGGFGLSGNGLVLKKYAGVTVSAYVRLAAAALFFVAGRIALTVGS